MSIIIIITITMIIDIIIITITMTIISFSFLKKPKHHLVELLFHQVLALYHLLSLLQQTSHLEAIFKRKHFFV